MGRTRPEDYDKVVFTRNLAALSEMVSNQSKLPGEAKLAFRNLIDQARDSLENLLAEKEQPLLVAASFGITYLLPTHEIKRNIDESLKILRKIRETSGTDVEKITLVISHLRAADSMINGLAKLSMKSQEEVFPMKRPAESALALMKDKFARNSIECKIEGTEKVKAWGKEDLITMILVNFLDNSFYWLLRKKPNERQVRIFVNEYVNRPTIIVSDSGPGFEDHDINIVTLPFFTRKPDGMGLGLYIADRIARMNGGNLLLLDPDDFPGLLPGANIAVSLRSPEGKRK